METLLVKCGCGCGTELEPPRRFVHGHNGRLRAYPIYDGPPKLCECGCGTPVSLAARTNPTFGHVKGQPVRFVTGHSGGPSLEQRFHDRVERGGEDDCWLWTGGRLPAGYGALWDKRINNNRATHRLAWEIAHGPIPDGLWVLHRCDNPPCCNPAHLFLGTQAENDADRTTKGRSSRGERHPDAKLNDQVVPEIRRRFAAGERARDLAVEFGVSPTTLWQAATGKTWKHVRDEGV